jgi:hypothetical protein
LERFTKLAQQPRVLNGDNSLRCKVRDQLELLVGERLDLLAVNSDRANDPLVSDHRHCQQSANACNISSCDGQWIAAEVGRISAQI